MTLALPVETKREQSNRHMKDYRQRKRSQGICIVGGCWNVVAPSSVALCLVHLGLAATLQRLRRSRNLPMVHAQAQARYKLNRKLGRCVQRCGRPAATGRAQCAYHLQLGRLLAQKRREQNLCTIPGCKSTPNPGFAQCPPHQEQSRIYGKARRAKYQRLGLCIVCSEPAVTKMHCEIHRQKHSRFVTRQRLAQIAAGLCAIPGCQKPPIENRRICSSHSELERKNSKAYALRQSILLKTLQQALAAHSSTQ